MKRIIWLPFILFFFTCDQRKEKNTQKSEPKTEQDSSTTKQAEMATSSSKKYSNDRFREVTVNRIDDNEFRITGEAQIFEANFNWVIEDGHNELKKGVAMTDAGAPEWGNFEFTVEINKVRENSTLMLILFETSAKDGSRKHQLPVKLY